MATRADSAKRALLETGVFVVACILTVLLGLLLSSLIYWLADHVTLKMVGWAVAILFLPGVWLFFYISERTNS